MMRMTQAQFDAFDKAVVPESMVAVALREIKASWAERDALTKQLANARAGLKAWAAMAYRFDCVCDGVLDSVYRPHKVLRELAHGDPLNEGLLAELAKLGKEGGP